MDIPVHAIKAGRLHIINNKAKVEQREKKSMNFHTKYMKTNADTNFSIINTKIVIQARWLMPAYQEFTEMKWETYLFVCIFFL